MATDAIHSSVHAPARPILVDGLFCTTVGAVGALASGPISTFMGLPSPLPLLIVGAITLIYGLTLTGWAVTRPVPRTLVGLVIGMNILWVVASLGLLLLNPTPLTDGGRWLVLLVAVDVGALAVWQWVSLRRR